MTFYISLPVLYFAALLQMVAISRLPLVNGTADLVMLIIAAWGIVGAGKSYLFWGLLGGLLIGFVTKVPWYAILFPYLLVSIFSHSLHGRIWQSPIFAMLLMAILGTFITQLSALFALSLNGVPLLIEECFTFVIVPSIFLNIILCLPVLLVVKDIAKWVNPGESYD